ILVSINNINKLLPLSTFYNSTVDFLDLSLDYDNWRNRNSSFSFCQYPFLISMGSKVLILELDAIRQMKEKLKQVIHSILFQNQASTPFLCLKIRREYLIEDSLNQLSKHSKDLKKKLTIKFIGEDGIDAGGLTKEWFMLLINELMNPKYGLFYYEKTSQYFWFNMNCLENEQNYFLFGVIVGLAIYNSTILNLQLPTALFKKLFNIELDLLDLKCYQPLIANNLEKLLNYNEDDIEDIFNLDFTYCYKRYGKIITVNLIENGENIMVNQKNKDEYVTKYIDYIFNKSIESQFSKFKKGFYKVCGGNALSLFQPLEIELLICGNPSPINLEELMAVTDYDGYIAEDITIKLFWQILDEFNEKELKKLIQFITGSERLPLNGVTNFKFKISYLSDDVRLLPIAHTCFNQLCLPKYLNYNHFKQKLIYSISESIGFTLV
ncbi:ubiquitin-protein ligase E3A, partial [Neoconidiobolus thromboides FSU 785]